MKVSIKYLRFQHQFGRTVAFCQLFDDETGQQVMPDAQLSEALARVHTSQATITNAQEILDSMVRLSGMGV